MNKIVYVVILLGSVAAYFAYSSVIRPEVGARDVIEDAVKLAKVDRKLSVEEEQLLRLQLALMDYTATHDGPPDSLSQLISKYMDQVPNNPRTGKPFKYLKVGKAYKLGGQVDEYNQSMEGGGSTEDSSSDGKDSKDKGQGSKKREDKSDLEQMASLYGDEDGFVNPNTMVEDLVPYSAAGKRDPFLPPDFGSAEDNCLGQLRLTTVLRDASDNRTAMVENESGIGRVVKVGDIMGCSADSGDGAEVVEIRDDVILMVRSVKTLSGSKREVIELRRSGAKTQKIQPGAAETN